VYELKASYTVKFSVASHNLST